MLQLRQHVLCLEPKACICTRTGPWCVLEQAETAAVSVLQLPGVQGLPGPSVYGGGFAPTVDSVAQAAAEGQWKT